MRRNKFYSKSAKRKDYGNLHARMDHKHKPKISRPAIAETG
jgi:hypothetical protein